MIYSGLALIWRPSETAVMRGTEVEWPSDRQLVGLTASGGLFKIVRNENCRERERRKREKFVCMSAMWWK